MKYKFLLLLIFSFITLYGENTPAKIALIFEQKGNFYDAITEYERAYFFSRDHKYLLKVAFLYRELGKYKQSNMLLEYLYTKISDKNTFYKIQIMEISNDILLNNFTQAEILLEKIPNSIKNKYKELTNLQYILIYLATNREYKALALISNIKQKNIKIFSEHFKNLVKKKYSPKYIKIMSTIVPGSGQILVGKYFAGIDAFLLNSAIFYLWYKLFIQKDYFDLFVYFISLKRYYVGQREKAFAYAQRYNAKIQKKLIQMTKKYLMF